MVAPHVVGHVYVLSGRCRLGRIVLCLILAVFWCLYAGCEASAASVPSPASYEKAKEDLEALYRDARRSGWRDPWVELAERFQRIYEKEKNWVNRPAALYRSAVALDELARRSYSRKDAQQAVARYLLVADRHRTNPLADDALLMAARLQVDRLGDLPEAKRTTDRLCRTWPKSDSCQQVKADERFLSRTGRLSDIKARNASEKATEVLANAGPEKKRRPVRIRSLDWSSKGKIVKIVVTLDRPTMWELSSRKGSSAKDPSRLELELVNARPDAAVKPEGKIPKSVLQRVRLEYNKSSLSSLLLDFSKLARFSIQEENDGRRLIILATGTASALKGGLGVGKSVRSESYADLPDRKAGRSGQKFWVKTSKLASQFGLHVRTIIIDPGHGGKDPGTHHNGILEKEVVLDLAKRLGKALEAEGFEIRYTRTKDAWISLNDRVGKANRLKGDLFISLHINANSKSKQVGLETYYLDMAGSTAAASLASSENMLSNRRLGDLKKTIDELMHSARREESIRLARDVQRQTLRYLQGKGYTVENGGCRGAPFVVLIGTNMPAILVEAGYCTNAREAKRLASPAYRAALVQGITQGVLTYADRL